MVFFLLRISPRNILAVRFAKSTIGSLGINNTLTRQPISGFRCSTHPLVRVWNQSFRQWRSGVRCTQRFGLKRPALPSGFREASGLLSWSGIDNCHVCPFNRIRVVLCVSGGGDSERQIVSAGKNLFYRKQNAFQVIYCIHKKCFGGFHMSGGGRPQKIRNLQGSGA